VTHPSDAPSGPELLRDLDRDSGWTLMVEGAEQSYVDVVDATHLEFEYMQHIALTVDAVFGDERPLSVLHLGGGACTLARWLAATRPGSTQVVVEASQAILDAVRPLGDIPGSRVVHGDAVAVLETEPEGGRDLVIWDLYDGPRVVTASLTLRVFGEMRRVLRAGGLAVLNVSDATPFDLVRPVVAGLRVTFADVALLAEPSTLRGRRSGNCVIVGVTGSLPVAALRRAAAAASARARVLWDDSLAVFTGDAVPPTEERPLPEPDESVGRGFL
jgi:spermidine synthase